MRIHDVAQRSEEWRLLRLGRLTGSRAKDALATIKSGEAAARRDLRMQLCIERLTGIPTENGYVNADMQWGIDHEAEAIAAYEALSGALVEPIGFCEHDEWMAGTSPDGFVGDDGILSVKCPRSANHAGYLRGGVEPREHAAQNTHELWLTDRKWIDFVSFDPRMPDGLRLFVVRCTRTRDQIGAYEVNVHNFLAEVTVEEQALRTLAGMQWRAAAEATA